MFRIILASASPRRKEIMEQMGIAYEVMAAQVKEEVEEKEPAAMVEALASLKAKNVAEGIKDGQDNYIIIGADTMVFHKNNALGKPKDREEAIKMLQSLSDDIHEVYTGVCIIIKSNNKVKEFNKEIVFSVNTQVVVAPLSMEEIIDYVDTGEAYDKAGAYAIQGGFGIYIKEIHGDYYNVVGFPIAKIYEKLLELGINIKK